MNILSSYQAQIACISHLSLKEQLISNMREWSSKDTSVEILSHKVDDKPKALGTYFWNLRFEVIKWKKQKQKKKLLEKREKKVKRVN